MHAVPPGSPSLAEQRVYGQQDGRQPLGRAGRLERDLAGVEAASELDEHPVLLGLCPLGVHGGPADAELLAGVDGVVDEAGLESLLPREAELLLELLLLGR